MGIKYAKCDENVRSVIHRIKSVKMGLQDRPVKTETVSERQRLTLRV